MVLNVQCRLYYCDIGCLPFINTSKIRLNMHNNPPPITLTQNDKAPILASGNRLHSHDNDNKSVIMLKVRNHIHLFIVRPIQPNAKEQNAYPVGESISAFTNMLKLSTVPIVETTNRAKMNANLLRDIYLNEYSIFMILSF